MNLRWERADRVQRRASICCVHFFEIRYGLELFFLIPTESHGLLSCLCLDCVIWTQPTDLKERKVSGETYFLCFFKTCLLRHRHRASLLTMSSRTPQSTVHISPHSFQHNRFLSAVVFTWRHLFASRCRVVSLSCNNPLLHY